MRRWSKICSVLERIWATLPPPSRLGLCTLWLKLADWCHDTCRDVFVSFSVLLYSTWEAVIKSPSAFTSPTSECESDKHKAADMWTFSLAGKTVTPERNRDSHRPSPNTVLQEETGWEVGGCRIGLSGPDDGLERHLEFMHSVTHVHSFICVLLRNKPLSTSTSNVSFCIGWS